MSSFISGLPPSGSDFSIYVSIRFARNFEQISQIIPVVVAGIRLVPIPVIAPVVIVVIVIVVIPLPFEPSIPVSPVLVDSPIGCALAVLSWVEILPSTTQLAALRVPRGRWSIRSVSSPRMGPWPE